MALFTSLVDTGDLCGEGPLWDPRRQCLYWTDCVGKRFHRYDWAAARYTAVKEGLGINGCAFHVDGGFIVSNPSGIWSWDGEGEPRLIHGEIDGHPCQTNDCIADERGRFLTGSFHYDPSIAGYRLGCLFSIDLNGEARVLDEGFHLSNGLGFSPDGRTLYFTDSVARRIYAYDYDPASGDASRRRIFVQVPGDEGLPDGLTVDEQGFVWSAQWYGSCVTRYDPDGTLERRIACPAKQTSSIAFGGPDLTDVFVTSAGHSEPMPVMPPGYNPASGYVGGALFHGNLGIRGRTEFSAAIPIPGVEEASNATARS
ncbi:MAG: SMP-30/gluconolactonase/LRE family protein [Bryobacteraceae bacterium]